MQLIIRKFRQQLSKSFLTSLMAILVCFVLLIVSGYIMPIHSALSEQKIAQQIDLGQSFRDLGVDGSIVIYDKNNARFYEHNPSRNTTAFFPASTFKIFNALVSLETGVIQDDVAVLTWDGIKRDIPAWNRDTNLRQAFKDSTVWFYQVLARKIGHQRMRQFIDRVGYGNRQIGTEEKIDRFWLEGPLQITPKQEIEFLRKLEGNNLPFSERTLDLVKDIMIVERTPTYTLRGKTGWANSVQPNIGWFVGYLQQNNNVYFFATNIAMSNANDAPKRLEITRRSLKALGLL
ncbi:class D beta-lactamase [[Phormidium] sp. LEGE 05292]|uniref:class D beta-lactamase n=1 Tax=[Phormidium] sp. LEGE 05292 TaxID=767427 RepID=UPI001D138C6D|nr:class D beta-lactamase [Phormidium sp. LEGE 05292]